MQRGEVVKMCNEEYKGSLLGRGKGEKKGGGRGGGEGCWAVIAIIVAEFS